MACHAARRLLEMNQNLAHILGIELLSAAQGIRLRAPLATSTKLQAAVQVVRQEVSALDDDRYISPDLVKAGALVRTPSLLAGAEIDLALEM